MPICLTHFPHNRNSTKRRGKTTLAIHDHKEHWSVYDHGQTTNNKMYYNAKTLL
jgi:hypothetical protein